MIAPGTGVRVYLACGVTDMRKGITGLAAVAQQVLNQIPTSGAVFAFRGRRGDRIKLLYCDGQGFTVMARASASTTRCWSAAAFRGHGGFAKLYQASADTEPRVREAACWAHLRRDFHDI